MTQRPYKVKLAIIGAAMCIRTTAANSGCLEDLKARIGECIQIELRARTDLMDTSGYDRCAQKYAAQEEVCRSSRSDQRNDGHPQHNRGSCVGEPENCVTFDSVPADVRGSGSEKFTSALKPSGGKCECNTYMSPPWYCEHLRGTAADRCRKENGRWIKACNMWTLAHC